MYYKYKVGWYREDSDKEEDNVGVVWASSYGDAADAVVEDYGKDYVINIHLSEIIMDSEDARCITDKEIKHALWHD